MKLFFIIACLVFLFFSCNRNDHGLCCDTVGIEMIRIQTQCTDPWGYGRSKAETIALLKEYLLKKKITINAIDLQSTGETLLCQACHCSSGNQFHVWLTDLKLIDSLKKEGFVIR
jgi:hypothetical protein